MLVRALTPQAKYDCQDSSFALMFLQYIGQALHALGDVFFRSHCKRDPDIWAWEWRCGTKTMGNPSYTPHSKAFQCHQHALVSTVQLSFESKTWD